MAGRAEWACKGQVATLRIVHWWASAVVVAPAVVCRALCRTRGISQCTEAGDDAHACVVVATLSGGTTQPPIRPLVLQGEERLVRSLPEDAGGVQPAHAHRPQGAHGQIPAVAGLRRQVATACGTKAQQKQNGVCAGWW
jgi:hypothetical protein